MIKRQVLLQLQASRPHITLPTGRKESSFVYLLKNEEHFFKTPSENFPLSQISLARVVSYTDAETSDWQGDQGTMTDGEQEWLISWGHGRIHLPERVVV